MINLWTLLFGWIPDNTIRLAIGGLLAIAVLFIILRIVKIVLDALPFL